MSGRLTEKRGILAAAVLTLAAGPALAHHSFAMFDRSRTVDLVGTVKEFQWTNPHSWILTENGPNVMRIYTDGRAHLGPDGIRATYTGDSVGHWEGQTLTLGTHGKPIDKSVDPAH